MMKVDYKWLYAELVSTGALYEGFPQLTGNWEDDKETFIEIMKNLSE